MSNLIEFGISKRGKKTAIFRNFEYWNYRTNLNGITTWRCCKREQNNCLAKLFTEGDHVVRQEPDHTHFGNGSISLARKAVGIMKERISQDIATPSSVQASVMVTLNDHVLTALPKRSTLNQCLRRSRNKSRISNNLIFPPIPHDLTFDIPEPFRDFVLYDSGSGDNRIILMGDLELLDGLARSDVWLADGTFKTVPTLYFQLYSIHFQYAEAVNPAAVYCLLPNKTKATYDRMLIEIQRLIPTSAPSVILTDFESAAMSSFGEAFPSASISGCYFHLCQSVLRKVNELGMKIDYESNNDLRIAVRCLPALAYVPSVDVAEAFDLLTESMPRYEKIEELLWYFDHTYIRGRRLRGRVENYAPALFPIHMWNKFDASIEGIARTTNAVEGWHCGLQSLFMCSHPTMWTFLEGMKKESCKQKAVYLQTTSGVEHHASKKYRDLQAKVHRAVANYGRTNVLTYLRCLAHLSHT